MNFTPFPLIQTERLILRQLRESDSDEILYLRSNPVINKYIRRESNKQTKNIQDALDFIQRINRGIEINSSISWSITLKNSPKTIGTICLWNFSNQNRCAEIGYDLALDFQGKGIMNEAMQAVLTFGFDSLNLQKIEAFTHKENSSSQKLLVKNGFRLRAERFDVDNPDNCIFEIEKTE